MAEPSSNMASLPSATELVKSFKDFQTFAINNEEKKRGALAAQADPDFLIMCLSRLNSVFRPHEIKRSHRPTQDNICDLVIGDYASWLSKTFQFVKKGPSPRSREVVLYLDGIEFKTPPITHSSWPRESGDLLKKNFQGGSKRWVYMFMELLWFWSTIKLLGRNVEVRIETSRNVITGEQEYSFGGFTPKYIWADAATEKQEHVPQKIHEVRCYPWTNALLSRPLVLIIQSRYWNEQVYTEIEDTTRKLEEYYGNRLQDMKFDVHNSVDFILTYAPSMLNTHPDIPPAKFTTLCSKLKLDFNENQRETRQVSPTSSKEISQSPSGDVIQTYMAKKEAYDNLLLTSEAENMKSTASENVKARLSGRKHEFPLEDTALVHIKQLQEEYYNAQVVANRKVQEQMDQHQKEISDLKEAIAIYHKDFKRLDSVTAPYMHAIHAGNLEFGQFMKNGRWHGKRKAEIEHLRQYKEQRDSAVHGAQIKVHLNYHSCNNRMDFEIRALYGLGTTIDDAMLYWIDGPDAPAQSIQEMAWSKLRTHPANTDLITEAVEAHFFIQMLACNPVQKMRTYVGNVHDLKLPIDINRLPQHAEAKRQIQNREKFDSILEHSTTSVQDFLGRISLRHNVVLAAGKRYPDKAAFDRHIAGSEINLSRRTVLRMEEWRRIMTFVQFVAIVIIPEINKLDKSLTIPQLVEWRKLVSDPTQPTKTMEPLDTTQVFG